MLLLLMRHGIAQNSEEAADDFSRALTRQGRRRATRAARGLRKLVPRIDMIASSPKVRAWQTAQIVSEVFESPTLSLLQWDELMKADYSRLRNKLARLKHQTVLLSGHEPYLSEFASFLLCGDAHAMSIEFKKAGVCALEVQFSPPGATLLWQCGPKVLRALSRADF